MAAIASYEGKAKYDIPSAGKDCFTTYTVYGDLDSGKRPLVVLHGGPGAGSKYLKPLSQLAPRTGHPVIIYDQVGCSNSTHLQDKMGDTSFWTVDLFINELANLVAHLKLETYDLFGNSWGGMLAAEVALTKPKGLNKIIVADSPASMTTWVEEAQRLLAQLPKDVQETIAKHEREGTTDDPAYEKAVEVYYKRHLCRMWPWPQGILDMLDDIKEDPTVYHTMNGPSEFHVIGPLRSWDITSRLHEIENVTLVINGGFDEATDLCVLPYFREIPKAKWYTFAQSGHVPQYDEPEKFLEILGDFIQW